MTVENQMRARELRRQLAGMADLPNNPAQIFRRHLLLSEAEWLETGSQTHTEPEEKNDG